MSSSFASWYFMAVLDLLATEPEKGFTRHEIKAAFHSNDPRLQLENNPLAGEGGSKIPPKLSTKTNAKLYKMLAGKLIQFEEKVPKSLDVFTLTEAGIDQQEYYKERRDLIKPPRKAYPRVIRKSPAIPARFSVEADAAYAEVMKHIMAGVDLEKGFNEAEDLLTNILANVPDEVLHAHATPNTVMGQMAAKNNKWIGAYRRILLSMEKVERTPQETQEVNDHAE